jgi:hypothetical protein
VTTHGLDWRSRRARVPLENGLVLSVVWGSGTYGDNFHHGVRRGEFTEKPTAVEVAIYREGGDGLLPAAGDGDTVIGYVPVSALPRLVADVGRLRSDVAEVPQHVIDAVRRLDA